MKELFGLSVVIPTYNRPLLLERSLRSIVRSQHGYNVEIIVIDNQSKPAVNLDEFNNLNMTLIRLDDNYGPAIARNKGIERARYNLILPLDDDDELTPNAIDTIYNLFATKSELFRKYPVVCFACSTSNLTDNYFVYKESEYLNSSYGDVAAVIVKNQWMKYGLSYPNLKIGGEALLWLLLANKYGIPVINKTIVVVNNDAEVRLTDFLNQINRAAEHMSFQKECLLTIYEKRHLYKRFYKKKILGHTLYAALSGNRKVAFLLLWELDISCGFFLNNLLLLAVPKCLLRSLFLFYRGKSGSR